MGTGGSMRHSPCADTFDLEKARQSSELCVRDTARSIQTSPEEKERHETNLLVATASHAALIATGALRGDIANTASSIFQILVSAGKEASEQFERTICETIILHVIKMIRLRRPEIVRSPVLKEAYRKIQDITIRPDANIPERHWYLSCLAVIWDMFCPDPTDGVLEHFDDAFKAVEDELETYASSLDVSDDSETYADNAGKAILTGYVEAQVEEATSIVGASMTSQKTQFRELAIRFLLHGFLLDKLGTIMGEKDCQFREKLENLTRHVLAMKRGEPGLLNADLLWQCPRVSPNGHDTEVTGTGNAEEATREGSGEELLDQIRSQVDTLWTMITNPTLESGEPISEKYVTKDGGIVHGEEWIQWYRTRQEKKEGMTADKVNKLVQKKKDACWSYSAFRGESVRPRRSERKDGANFRFRRIGPFSKY
eukprot:g2728.t1